jgi:starch synthase (maltosyl-transferring)
MRSTHAEPASLKSASAASVVVINDVQPQIDGGRHPIKREVGDALEVRATIFKEGHDRIAAVLKLRRAGTGEWRETPMELENVGLDLWRGVCVLKEIGRFEYTIEAWTDVFESFRDELQKKLDADQDIANELMEGREIVAHEYHVRMSVLDFANHPMPERHGLCMWVVDGAADGDGPLSRPCSRERP